MNIAQVAPVYPPYRGGMGAVAFEYTERLRQLGHTVEVFTPSWKIGNAGFLSWNDLWRLRQFDVVHLHYPFYGGAEQIALFSLFHKRPLVLTYHMDAIASGPKGWFFALHRRLIQPFILRTTQKILVSSMDYANHSALRRYPAKEKITELPFGVDVGRFHPMVEPKNKPHRLLFVGGLDTPHVFKGFPVLLQALPHVVGEWILFVIGEGNLKFGFELKVQMMGLADRVRFVGAVGVDLLPAYYRHADIHLFPSTTSAEAFGLVALEAAASGIPTIASNLPGVRTVVEDGQTGVLVPPRDSQALAETINRLLSHSEERARMGKAARERAVQRYAWDEVIKKLVLIYENLHRN